MGVLQHCLYLFVCICICHNVAATHIRTWLKSDTTNYFAAEISFPSAADPALSPFYIHSTESRSQAGLASLCM